jgi:hypothetical protein
METIMTKTAKPSRESQLHALLSQTGGASINEIIQAFGWARHSCRGLISTSRRKHGWDVERTTVAGRGTVYSIASSPKAKASKASAAAPQASAKAKPKAKRSARASA